MSAINYINEHGSYMKLLAWNYTQNNDDAMDLLQDTNYKIITRWHQFKDGTNFKAWANMIMRNLFINQYRKNKRNSEKREVHQDRVTTTVKEDFIYSPLNESIINSELNRLKPSLSEVILLYIQGYSYEEISQAIGRPIGTVKSRIFLARKELKHRLTKLDLI